MENYVNITLLRAAERGNVRVLKQMLKKGADVNRRDLYHRTPLMLALDNGHDEAAHLLIKAGADVWNSLIDAARDGNAKCVSLLIETRSDQNLVLPLWNAVENNQVECVRLLIKAGADVNFYLHMDLLCLASRGDYYQCLNLLIQAGADVNNNNPLRYAAANGHVKCVTLLINAGADVNMMGPANYETALMLAVKNNQVESASIIIKSGADVNRWKGFLGYAYSVETVRLLLRSGAKINIVWYCQYDYRSREYKAVKLLFAAGDRCLQDRYHSPEKADDLMGMCREAIREHLLDLDQHTHLFGRVTRLGLPAALVSYLVFDQTLEDDEIDQDFTVDNE